MTQQLLIENLSPAQAMLAEQKTGQDMYLSGIMMSSEISNGNGRKYALKEMSEQVDQLNKRIKEGFSNVGELNHPDSLSINLANVSHVVTEMRMDGTNAVGKLKLLNTPSGNIAKALIEGGVRIGVSSRGTGSVNESGDVSGFQYVCMDLVATPSAPDAYPKMVREALESQKIITLAEAVVHDPKAQAFFKKEMKAFIEKLMR